MSSKKSNKPKKTTPKKKKSSKKESNKKESSKKSSKKTHGLVILDIDSTLMDSTPNGSSRSGQNADVSYMGYSNYKRPFSDLFIKECFDKFKYVAIWTAGSEKWAKNFVKNVLEMKKSDFLFVWDVRHCTQNTNQGIITSCKPLKKVWKKREIRSLGLGKSNVFLVDDREYNGIYNRHNQLTIPGYDFSKGDDTLGQLIIYFQELNWDDCREAIAKIKLSRKLLGK